MLKVEVLTRWEVKTAATSTTGATNVKTVRSFVARVNYSEQKRQRVALQVGKTNLRIGSNFNRILHENSILLILNSLNVAGVFFCFLFGKLGVPVTVFCSLAGLRGFVFLVFMSYALRSEGNVFVVFVLTDIELRGSKKCTPLG